MVKLFFIIVIRGSCLVIIDTEKNKKDFPKGKTKRDVAPLIMSGEELYDVISQYTDIVFSSQYGK